VAISAPATISAFTDISILKAWKLIGAAADDYTKYLTYLMVKNGKLKTSSYADKLPAEQKAIFDYISSQGWAEANFNHDAARAIQDANSRVFNYIIKKSMVMFGVTERANRMMTVFAAYNAIKQSSKPEYKNMTTEQALAEANVISNQTHGTYGKAAKPWVVQKFRASDLPYTFMKFTHNYVLNLLDLGFNKKHISSMMYMLLAPAMLSGAGASIVFTLALAIAKGLGVDDPEEAFYAYMADLTGSDALFRHGLVGSALGIDLKGSLQMNNPIPTTIPELFGAPGGVVMDIADAFVHYSYGEVIKGTESLLPTAFGNVFKGLREYDEGLTTTSYSPIYYGMQPVVGTKTDAMIRVFSFSPSRLSEIREKQWNETKIRQKYTEERSSILRRLRRYYAEPYNSDLLVEISDDIRAYNEAVYASKQSLLIPYINYKWIQQNINKTYKPNKYEVARSAQ
jgi:hypothetical protein